MLNIKNLMGNRKYQDRKRVLSEDIRAEMGRRSNQANRMITNLVYYGELETWQLQEIAASHTRRISDLRQRGYKIECEYKSPGNYVYHYYGFKPNTRAAKEQAKV